MLSYCLISLAGVAYLRQGPGHLVQNRLLYPISPMAIRKEWKMISGPSLYLMLKFERMVCTAIRKLHSRMDNPTGKDKLLSTVIREFPQTISALKLQGFHLYKHILHQKISKLYRVLGHP